MVHYYMCMYLVCLYKTCTHTHTGTPSRDIATQTIQSTATQTQHSPDPLTISDLVTMETTPRVQSHSEKVKDQTTLTLPMNPIRITPTREKNSPTTKKSSGNAASTSPSQNGSQTNTRSLLNQNPTSRKNATCMYSSDVGTSTINVVPSIASSSVGNDTLSSEQLESLLASALLNAQQTLNSIQTLSHSVEQEGTILVNSSRCGLSRTDTRDDVSAPVDKTLLSGSSSRDRSSAIHNNNNNNRGPVSGQSMCSDGVVVTDKRGGSNKMATPSSRKQFELDYELPALDTELAATLNPREIAEHSTLNTREIEHTQNQRARQVSTAEALCSTTDFEITGLGNLWNVRKNNLSIARNCPKKSSSKHTQERDVTSVLKHLRSDLRSGRLKTSTGGGAVTSTPSYVECGGNGMISHRLESLLGSSIEGEWVCVCIAQCMVVMMVHCVCLCGCIFAIFT